jgi:biopolymer transport protein ExbD
MVPLIDLVFLTLGSVLAAMTQMEHVEALAVDVARVGTGQAITQQGELRIVTLTDQGLELEGEKLTAGQIADRVGSEKTILRAQKSLPTEQTLQALADLAELRLNVILEVTTQRQPDGLAQGSP